MNCQHCGRWKAIRPRGLCTTCFNNYGIRMRYPIDPKNVKFTTKKNLRDEPTDEELDALIAHQMANLPAWWDRANGGCV